MVTLTDDGQVTVIDNGGLNSGLGTILHNPAIKMIAAPADTNDKVLFFLSAGQIYSFNNILRTVGSTDTNSNNNAIMYSGGHLYTLRQGGQFCRLESNGWNEIDNNPDNYMATVDGNRAYVLHRGGQLWSLEPSGPTLIDDNTEIWSIIAADGQMYKIHGGIKPDWGEVWRYDGHPHQWTLIALSTNDHRALVALKGRLYRFMVDGTCLLYSGTPNQWSFAGNIKDLFDPTSSVSGGIFLDGNASPVDGIALAREAGACLVGVGVLSVGTFASDGLLTSLVYQWLTAIGLGLTVCSDAVIDGVQYHSYIPPPTSGAIFAGITHATRRRRNTGKH